MFNLQRMISEIASFFSDLSVLSINTFILHLLYSVCYNEFIYTEGLTFAMASIPCSDMSVSILASIHLRNTSSSILSTCSSSCKQNTFPMSSHFNVKLHYNYNYFYLIRFRTQKISHNWKEISLVQNNFVHYP